MTVTATVLCTLEITKSEYLLNKTYALFAQLISFPHAPLKKHQGSIRHTNKVQQKQGTDKMKNTNAKVLEGSVAQAMAKGKGGLDSMHFIPPVANEQFFAINT